MSVVRILHLEDSPLDCELVKRLLARESIEAEIRWADSRRTFVEAWKQGNYDLVLADYSLPGFDGISALRMVRETAPDLPFIFVSGVLGEEIAIETLKSGATDYVLKRRLERLGPSVRRALQENESRVQRRLAEEALQETEQRFQKIADSAPVLIWMTDKTGECIFFNRTWLAFTGRSLEEELALGCTENMHPDDVDRWNETFVRHFANRMPLTLELRMRRHDDECRLVVVSGVPRFGSSDSFLGFIGSCIDLTEIKKTEERLRHVAKLESLGILAGGIAHDFNNLLTGIIGHAHLLREEMDEDDRRLDLVESIIQAGDTAAQLTRQMLAYSGRGRFVIESVNLSDQLLENHSLVSASIPRNVTIKYDLDESIPLIEADPAQLQQISMNLIINAGEAAEPVRGSITVRTYRLVVRDSKSEPNLTGDPVIPGPYVVLEVSDTGTGMDAETQARIFDPFFTTKFTGRGLGLAAVIGIVRGHKGAIQLRSEPGKGSTFTVLFPEAEARIENKPPGNFAGGFRGAGTVLVVDDVALVVRTLDLTLKRAGFHVLTAKNGNAALELLREGKHKIDVVLLDMTMPVMGGEETLMHLRALWPGIPVVGMSGFSETEALGRFGDQLDGFVQKPFVGVQFLRTVQEAIESRAGVVARRGGDA